MSRKFRWFVLASCAFVVLMGAGESISLLAAGPQVANPSLEPRAVAASANPNAARTLLSAGDPGERSEVAPDAPRARQP